MNIFARTTTATPSPHTLPCQACTAHAPGVSSLASAFLAAVIVAYVMGWAAGRERQRRTIGRLFGTRKKG